MAMRTQVLAIVPVLVLTLVLVAAPAKADTFGGFSGVDRPYLVNQDRVCAPLAVSGAPGVASGIPVCDKAAADLVAKLSIKEPVVQRGAKASFAAAASGKTLTVTRTQGDVVVTWQAADPIGKIVEVYASQYEDRVAVAYTVRRLGKEVTEIVAFELVKTTGRTGGTAGSGTGTGTPAGTGGAGAGTGTPTGAGIAAGAGAHTATAAGAGSASTTPDSPALLKAVAAARGAGKAQAAAVAWRKVLGLDPAHSEARYRIAVVEAGAKHVGESLAALATLAASSRADAIEWLVEARFDPAFAALRADPKYRAAVGLDRKAGTAYERLLGFGGQWEQTGTSCDKPQVRLNATRDRAVKIRVKAACEGQSFDQAFKGTWRLDQDQVVLSLPTAGHQATAKDEARCVFERAGDEDALHCDLGHDLEFVVLPTRS